MAMQHKIESNRNLKNDMLDIRHGFKNCTSFFTMKTNCRKLYLLFHYEDTGSLPHRDQNMKNITTSKIMKCEKKCGMKSCRLDENKKNSIWFIKTSIDHQ